MQLDYLLNRSDIDTSSLPVARAVIEAMNELANNYTNDDFEKQLSRLEDRLLSFGYKQCEY